MEKIRDIIVSIDDTPLKEIQELTGEEPMEQLDNIIEGYVQEAFDLKYNDQYALPYSDKK